jgi:hypothetical protein
MNARKSETSTMRQEPSKVEIHRERKTQAFTKISFSLGGGASLGMIVLYFSPMAAVPAIAAGLGATMAICAWLVWLERDLP